MGKGIAAKITWESWNDLISVSLSELKMSLLKSKSNILNLTLWHILKLSVKLWLVKGIRYNWSFINNPVIKNYFLIHSFSTNMIDIVDVANIHVIAFLSGQV